MRDNLDREFIETAVFVILRALRRKNLLTPADLTELRVALAHRRTPENLSNKLARLLEETLLEREEKKDTPHKPD